MLRSLEHLLSSTIRGLLGLEGKESIILYLPLFIARSSQSS